MVYRSRRLAGLVALWLCTLGGACDRADDTSLAPSSRQSLREGRTYARALIENGRSVHAMTSAEVIALGYLERLRLGLGSPFRLIDLALHDPRLDPSARERLSRSLLARTLDGEAYRIDAAALSGFSPTFGQAGRSVGADHLAIIEEAVTGADDPRIGELAIRLAYLIAAAEGSVTADAPRKAAGVAALLCDRELARQDVRRLFAAAEAAGVAVDRLVPAWRAGRRFAVEAPRVTSLGPPAEQAALQQVPILIRAIRAVGLLRAGEGRASVDRAGPTLTPALARRLGVLADSLNPPPQTATVVAAQIYRNHILAMREVSEAERRARLDFLSRALDEERFASEHAVWWRTAATKLLPATVALRAAVALRSFAQEEVWFPGMPGPPLSELEIRNGVSVTFDPGIPGEWRPYMRRMLLSAILDFRRVVPLADFHGLRVRVTEEGRPSPKTLAFHQPGPRILYLPPTTAAGSLAHELAHDLDLQLARRRFGVGGTYATDYATRHGKPFARVVQRLTLGPPGHPAPASGGVRPDAAERPAEVFARRVDWLVMVALARERRSNGYISSMQNHVLTGYGTAAAPEVGGATAAALLEILDEAAPLPAELHRWVGSHLGRGRILAPYDLVGLVLGPQDEPEPQIEIDAAGEAASGAVAENTRLPVYDFADVERRRAAALGVVDEWSCRAGSALLAPYLDTARRRLVGLAAGANARGIALSQVERHLGARARREAAMRLYFGPSLRLFADSAVAAHYGALFREVQTLEEVEIGDDGPATRPGVAAAGCALLEPAVGVLRTPPRPFRPWRAWPAE